MPQLPHWSQTSTQAPDRQHHLEDQKRHARELAVKSGGLKRMLKKNKKGDFRKQEAECLACRRL